MSNNTGGYMADGHTVRIRQKRWEKIEKHAWKLSSKAQRIIKPTDIADACLELYADKITIDDIEKAKDTR
jgi:hypothetical protein